MESKTYQVFVGWLVAYFMKTTVAHIIKVEMSIPEKHDRCSHKRAKSFVIFSLLVNVAFGRSFGLIA